MMPDAGDPSCDHDWESVEGGATAWCTKCPAERAWSVIAREEQRRRQEAEKASADDRSTIVRLSLDRDQWEANAEEAMRDSDRWRDCLTRAVAEGHRIGAYWTSRIVELVDPLKREVRELQQALKDKGYELDAEVKATLARQSALILKGEARIRELEEACDTATGLRYEAATIAAQYFSRICELEAGMEKVAATAPACHVPDCQRCAVKVARAALEKKTSEVRLSDNDRPQPVPQGRVDQGGSREMASDPAPAGAPEKPASWLSSDELTAIAARAAAEEAEGPEFQVAGRPPSMESRFSVYVKSLLQHGFLSPEQVDGQGRLRLDALWKILQERFYQEQCE